MKSLRGGNMETYNILIQIHSTRSTEHSSTTMTSTRIWLWDTAPIASFSAEVPRMIQKRWTSKVCFQKDLRIKSRIAHKFSLIKHHIGKYNNNHIFKIRAKILNKCPLHFIRSFLVLCVSSQRCSQLRLWWWIKWIRDLICQTLLRRTLNLSLWTREISSQRVATS